MGKALLLIGFLLVSSPVLALSCTAFAIDCLFMAWAMSPGGNHCRTAEVSDYAYAAVLDGFEILDEDETWCPVVEECNPWEPDCDGSIPF